MNRCILLFSPFLFNISLEQTKTNALKSFIGTVTVGVRLRFADDIDLITGSKEQLTYLTSIDSWRVRREYEELDVRG